METEPNEEKLLRTVALQNARSIRLARERAERELVQTQEALRRSQQELTDFIEHASVAMHWVGPDGIIIWANRTELEMLGYTKEEYIGHHVVEFHVDAPVIENVLQRLANRETLHEMEARLRCKDGSIREVLISWNALWEDDKFVRARGFTRDITERKQAEKTRARLAAIVESSDDAIISKDLNGIITSWNRGAETLFGYAAHEVIGQSVTVLIPIDRQDEEPRILERIRGGERIEHYETVRRRKDGTLLDISLTVSPIVNAQGQIVGVSKIARDITERKQTEEKLRHAAERFRFMAESMPQKVFTAKPNGEMDYFNQQCIAFVGLALKQIKDAGWARLLHPDDVEESVRRWKESIDTGEAFQYEHRFRRHDGAYRWHLSRAYALRGTNSQVQMWIGSSTDINDQKELFEALQRAKEQLSNHAAVLERQVVERTAHLSESMKSMETMCYTIAHDLRGPLRWMSSFSDLLLIENASELNESGKDYLNRIAKSATQLDWLIRDLLEFGRIGQSELVCSNVCLERCVCAVIGTLAGEIAATGADIDVRRPLPQAKGQEALLQQVLANLIENALKFVAPGVAPRVRIWAESDPATVRLCVADNGIGIASEHRERIFQIFQRLSDGYPGTGVGLAIARKAVERMGGKVIVESEPNNGSRFWIELKQAH